MRPPSVEVDVDETEEVIEEEVEEETEEMVVEEPIVRDQEIGQARASWTNWRGPDGTGAVKGAKPPTTWSEDKNIKWKIDLPGDGTSCPVVLGDRVYVTTAIDSGAGGEEPQEGGRQGGRRGGFGRGRGKPTREWTYAVIAYDRATGKRVWRKDVAKMVPVDRTHSTGSQCAPSPLTDGKHLYASFGSIGIYCLNLANGEVTWSKDLGDMRTRASFGEGSSPCLSGNTLIVPWDHEGDSFGRCTRQAQR